MFFLWFHIDTGKSEEPHFAPTLGSRSGPGNLRGPFVPGHFLTLIPAFLIDLMIGQETLGCQP